MANLSFKDQLFKSIDSLSKKDRDLFNKIFEVTVVRGKVKIPKSMISWVKKHFGNVEDVENQYIVKVTNLVTFEGAVFNDLRSKRPEIKVDDSLFEYKQCGNEPFCDALRKTPEDVFGRIEGKYCVTAANIAKIDGYHSLLVFRDHNPLDFSASKIHDYFETAISWFKKVHEADSSFVYPFFMWNCLWKAGASIVHGHAQVTMARDVAYSKIEFLRERSLMYQEENKSNYFEDLYQVHKALGLGLEIQGVKIITSLCPIKESGIIMFAKAFDGSLSFVVNDILRILVDRFGVRSFNLVVIPNPITKTYEKWDHMPIIVQIVDRGELDSRQSDFGSMELFAQSVVGSNPYELFRVLEEESKPR